MTIDLTKLEGIPRLLIEADLKPLQGTRFQPTGFPNLGPARYQDPSGTEMLLVESAQSMANRMEAVCWDEKADDWVPPLRGLPFVRVKDSSDNVLTNSILEAHRLNSAYIENTAWFSEFKKEIKYDEKAKRPINMRQQVYPIIFKYDPNSLIHGFFLESIAGVIRSPRALSGFIEARDVRVASSGGVKNDRVDASKGELGGAKENYGNVPFPRDEFTGKMTAYFNVDLAQIRAFGLSDDSTRLLILLSIYKIRSMLTGGLRLRTACDLDVAGPDEPKVIRPTKFGIPSLEDIGTEIKALIASITLDKKSPFSSPSITEVTWVAKSKPPTSTNGARNLVDPIPQNG